MKHYKDIENQVIEGHIGTWYGIAECEFCGGIYYQLEHETYGDEAAHLIVDEDMNVIVEDSWNSIEEDFIEASPETLDVCTICRRIVYVDGAEADSVLYINDKCYCADCREEHTRWDEDLNEYVLVDQS
jgi:hypothetical protein